MRAVWYAVTNVLMLLIFCAYDVVAHSRRFTDEENAWMERQLAEDGTKCCNQHDVHFLDQPQWRSTGGGYEVYVEGEWHEVPPGRLRVNQPDDPSPFGTEKALLFYSVHSGIVYVWCFTPPTMT